MWQSVTVGNLQDWVYAGEIGPREASDLQLTKIMEEAKGHPVFQLNFSM